MIVLLAWSLTALAADEPQLSKLSLEQLGRIEVTSTTKEPEEVWRTPAAVFVLTREDIRRSGATSLAELLRLVPGVEVARIDSDTWSIGMRGFGSRLSKSVLVLIDGRSVYTPLFGGVYWEDQDTLLADIERIEVTRGPGATVWGANAVNGVINIVTRSARDTHGVLATAEAGTVEHGSAGVRYGGSNNRGLDYRVYAKGFTRGPEYHPDGRSFDDWRVAQGGFRVDWDSAGRDVVTVQGDLYRGETGQRTSLSTYAPPASATPEGDVDIAGGNLLARWRRSFANGADVQVQGYYDHTHRLEIGFGEDRNAADVDFIHHFKVGGRHDLIWGLGANVASSDTIQTVPTVFFAPAHRLDHFLSAFAQDQVAVVPGRFSVTIGSKLLDNNYTGLEVEPSARLAWTPSARTTIWAAATHAVRTPSDIEEGLRFTQLVIPSLPTAPGVALYLRLTGDGAFRTETLDGYEGGYRVLVRDQISIDASVFANSYDHLFSAEAGAPLLETTPPPVRLVAPLLFRNGLYGNTQGFEIAPTWEATSAWRVTGSYAYLHMAIHARPDSTDTSSATAANGSSPHHQVVVRSLLTLPHGIEIDPTYRYVSALDALGIDGYHTADVRIGWRPTGRLELSLIGQNLLQPHHPEFAGDPGTIVGIARSVYAKVTWR